MLILFLFISYTFKKGSHIKELKAGLYTVECYGAQGGQAYKEGNLSATGGLGAYVKGTMNVTGTGTTFYIFVGGEGKSGKVGPNLGGFNGGGSSGKDLGGGFDKIDDAPGGGGGATDLRINDISTESRIIVAAGGSGGAGTCERAPGGEITGYYFSDDKTLSKALDVNQNGGIKDGVGGTGVDYNFVPGSGGGGGWRGGYGAGSGSQINFYLSVGKSGSSYISGHNGCTTHPQMKFTSTEMKKGVRKGDGFVNITVNFTCPNHCSSCTKRGTCNECFDGYFWINKQCILCPSNYLSGTKKCIPCNESCNTCAGKTSSCTSCKKGFYLYNKECLSVCPDGFYGSNSNNCEECHPPCKRCNKTEDDCLSCVEDYVLYEGKCVSTCPTNTLKTEKTCEPCQPFCLTCQMTTTNCTTCQEGYNLYNNECIPSCPPITFSKGQECIRCKSPCFTCDTNDDHCTTCEEGFFLYDNKCYDACPTGTKKIGVGCAPSNL